MIGYEPLTVVALTSTYHFPFETGMDAPAKFVAPVPANLRPPNEYVG